MFVFGSSAGPSKDVGLDQNPFSFSQIATPNARPDITGKKRRDYYPESMQLWGEQKSGRCFTRTKSFQLETRRSNG